MHTRVYIPGVRVGCAMMPLVLALVAELLEGFAEDAGGGIVRGLVTTAFQAHGFLCSLCEYIYM